MGIIYGKIAVIKMQFPSSLFLHLIKRGVRVHRQPRFEPHIVPPKSHQVYCDPYRVWSLNSEHCHMWPQNKT